MTPVLLFISMHKHITLPSGRARLCPNPLCRELHNSSKGKICLGPPLKSGISFIGGPFPGWVLNVLKLVDHSRFNILDIPELRRVLRYLTEKGMVAPHQTFHKKLVKIYRLIIMATCVYRGTKYR